MDIEAGRIGHTPAAAAKERSSSSRFLWLRRLILLALLFTASLSIVIALALSLRAEFGLKERQQLLLRLPRDIDELRMVRDTLEEYQQQHKLHVQLGIVCLYLFLQAFMMPGTFFLNILAGSFYGFYEALLFVTVLASIGSSLCFMLSRYIIKDIVYYYYPDRCDGFAKEVHAHRHSLLNYVLFLRITPLLPNWFINVSSPLVSVPFREFFVGTFIGVIPASVVAVKAGRILSQLNSINDLYDARTVGVICFLALLVIAPVVSRRRLDMSRSSSSGKIT